MSIIEVLAKGSTCIASLIENQVAPETGDSVVKLMSSDERARSEGPGSLVRLYQGDLSFVPLVNGVRKGSAEAITFKIVALNTKNSGRYLGSTAMQSMVESMLPAVLSSGPDENEDGFKEATNARSLSIGGKRVRVSIPVGTFDAPTVLLQMVDDDGNFCSGKEITAEELVAVIDPDLWIPYETSEPRPPSDWAPAEEPRVALSLYGPAVAGAWPCMGKFLLGACQSGANCRSCKELQGAGTAEARARANAAFTRLAGYLTTELAGQVAKGASARQ